MADLLRAGAGALSAALAPFYRSSATTHCEHQHQQHTKAAVVGRRRRRARALLSAAAPLPVAGIDAAEAGGALHAVRRALAPREGGAQSCDLWLAALCCAQEASDRLLADLDDARRSAAFWRARMRAGGHGAFMLLGRGPVEFAAGVVGSLSGMVGAQKQREGQRRASLAVDGGGDEDKGGNGNDDANTAPQQQSSATDRIQERIDALDALSRRLAAAVAGVHHAADLLRLELPAGTAGADAAAAAVAAAPSAAAMAPSAPLASADPAAAERAIATCLRRLRQALQDVPVAAAEAARRGERGDDDEEAEAEAAAIAAPSPPPPRSRAAANANAATTTTATPIDDLAAIVAVLEGCPLCQGQTDDAATADNSTTKPDPSRLLLPRLLPSSRDAADALRSAASAALARGPLAPPPAWARMPSRLQRHWLRYSLAGACALAAGGWAYCHSSLNGSDDLERWSAEAGTTLTGAWRAHIVDPLLAVRRELLATLRDRPAIVSPAEFNEDREALLRMLRAFEEDHRGVEEEAAATDSADAAPAPAPSSPPPAAADPNDLDHQLLSRGMARVMTSYERELRNPLRNLLAGSLARAVLIQVQRLKLDTEAAMLELDQILRANELSLTLVAAVPSIVIAALLARGGWRLIVAAVLGAPPDTKREAVGCRMAMGALERALSAARGAAGAAAAAGAAGAGDEAAGGTRRKGGGGDDESEAAAAVVAVAEGAAVHALHAVFQEASRLYRLRALAGGPAGGGGGGSSSSSSSSSSWRRSGEWPFLREGLVQLARPPLSSPGKLEYHRHLTRTYALFQP